MTEENPICSTLVCNLDIHLLQAILPLLREGKVEAVEWSFDTLYRLPETPEWFTGLLKEFSRAGRLIGHGVYFSLFSGRWLPEQAQWLRELEALAREYRFDHVTEHFGFMTGPHFHKGAPLAVPMSATTLALGRDRLKRLAQACRCPVGLENLAFAWSREEAEKHGRFLDELLDPVNGFIILDLHNLYCQLHNFEMELEEALNLYPLERVREIHISGGSWVDSRVDPGRRIRRDTHDNAVPDAVTDMLARTIPLCPNLKYVVLEQMGVALHTETEQAQFRRDFAAMDRIVKQAAAHPAHGSRRSFPAPGDLQLPAAPLESAPLYQEQMQLSRILESSETPEKALAALRESLPAGSGWDFERWPAHMLETAMDITRKWKDGFN